MTQKRNYARHLLVVLVVLVVPAGLLIVFRERPDGFEPVDRGSAAGFGRRMEKAMELSDDGDTEGAVDMYHEIIQDAEKLIADFEAAIAEVEDLADREQYAGALAKAQEMSRKYLASKQDARNLQRARELAAKGENARAVEMYLRMLRNFSPVKLVESYTVEPRLLIARLKSRDDPASAVKEYRELLERVAEDSYKAQIYEGLGRLAERQGEIEKALEHFTRATELTKENRTLNVRRSLAQVAMLRKLERYREAMELLVGQMRSGGMGGTQLRLIEEVFLEVVDELAAAEKKAHGGLAAAKVYEQVMERYTEVPDWTVQWHIKAARACQQAGEFGRARRMLGQLWHNRDEEIDPVWQQAKIERMALDKAEEELTNSTAFLKGVRARIKNDDYDCTIVDESIETDTTWSPDDGDIIVDGRVTVGLDARLTIRPRTVVKFTINSSLIIYGSIQARGTADARITFESSSPDPSPFDWGLPSNDPVWGGLQIVGLRSDAKTSLSYCDFRHAATCLLFEKTAAVVENCRLSQSGVAAVVVSDDADVRIENCWIGDNSGDGLTCNNSTNPSITDCTFERNGLNGLVFSGSCEPKVTGCTISRNQGKGIVCFDAVGGTILRSRITGNGGPGISCDTASAPRIVDSEISDNRDSGLVTSSRSAPVLIRCLISGNAPNGVLSRTASPRLVKCRITGNKPTGVRTKLMADVKLDSCMVRGNKTGLQTEEMSTLQVSNCILDGNSSWSVVLLGERDLDLSGNWWGTVDKTQIAKLIRQRKGAGTAKVDIGKPLDKAPDIRWEAKETQ